MARFFGRVTTSSKVPAKMPRAAAGMNDIDWRSGAAKEKGTQWVARSPLCRIKALIMARPGTRDGVSRRSSWRVQVRKYAKMPPVIYQNANDGRACQNATGMAALPGVG